MSLAQTPPGFAPSVEDKLEVTFGTKAVTEPGLALTKAGVYHDFTRAVHFKCEEIERARD